MENKSQWPEKVPVLPEWCDYHSHSPIRRFIFTGVTRAIIALLSFGLCVAFLAVYNSPLGVQILLGIILTHNLLHFFVTVYFIYKGRPGDPQIIRRWFIIDIVITGIYVTLILALLCTIPGEPLHIILGAKLIVVSLLICYRYSRYYIYLKDKLLPVNI